MGTGSFPGVKQPRRGADHPPLCSAEVEGRVQLYICSPSWPSWPVVGRALPLPLPFTRYFHPMFFSISECPLKTRAGKAIFPPPSRMDVNKMVLKVRIVKKKREVLKFWNALVKSAYRMTAYTTRSTLHIIETVFIILNFVNLSHTQNHLICDISH